MPRAWSARRHGRGGRRRGLVFLLLGVLYLVLAVVGITTVGWDEFGLEEPVRMLGFLGVSTLSCVVHGLLGMVLTIAGLRGAATGVAPVLIVVFLAMAVFGVVARTFGGTGDPLNLDWWNVLLYLGSALACGYVYVAGWRAASGDPDASRRRTG